MMKRVLVFVSSLMAGLLLFVSCIGVRNELSPFFHVMQVVLCDASGKSITAREAHAWQLSARLTSYTTQKIREGALLEVRIPNEEADTVAYQIVLSDPAFIYPPDYKKIRKWKQLNYLIELTLKGPNGEEETHELRIHCDDPKHIFGSGRLSYFIDDEACPISEDDKMPTIKLQVPQSQAAEK